jgi:hypothetical protein
LVMLMMVLRGRLRLLGRGPVAAGGGELKPVGRELDWIWL